MKPTALLAMFSVPQLEGVAQDVEDAIIKIMKEAAELIDWLLNAAKLDEAGCENRPIVEGYK